MADKFDGYQNGLGTPATGSEVIDISSTDHTLANISRGIWVGGSGNLKVDMKDSTGITFYNVPAGTLLPVRATKVYGASSASLLVSVW